MIPIKTIVIEQVRRDISSVKQAYVKLACNRVISPGISHIACESVETAIRTFMFGCLFSIFHHAIKNVSLIENTDQTFSLQAKRINRKSTIFGNFRMFLVPFFDLQNFILLVRTVPFLRKINFY